MSDRSIAGTVGGKGKISSRKLKQLTETAMAQYAAAVSLERNPATFGDAVIDISNNLNVQSANAFSAVKRAFTSAFMDATLGADPAGIRQLPDNLVHLAGLPGLQIQSLSPGSCGAPLVTGQSNDTVSFCSSTCSAQHSKCDEKRKRRCRHERKQQSASHAPRPLARLPDRRHTDNAEQDTTTQPTTHSAKTHEQHAHNHRQLHDTGR